MGARRSSAFASRSEHPGECSAEFKRHRFLLAWDLQRAAEIRFGVFALPGHA
jgi:hypothetical protein